MGWTSTNVQVKYKNGKEYIDRKEECDKLFNQPMVAMESNDIIGKYEVLKSSMRGTVYYAAVKKTKFATETESEQSSIFAAICLTSVEKDSHYNFSYTDMGAVDEGHRAVRFCTSWATKPQNVAALCAELRCLSK